MNEYGCRADKIYEVERVCLSKYPMITICYLKRMSMNFRNMFFFYMSYLLNGRQGIPKGQSKMDNPEKLATLGTQDENKRWTPLCENTHI
jgi:hypothetical protein